MLKINIPWTQLKVGDRLVCNEATVIIVMAVELCKRVWDHEGDIWNISDDHVMVIRSRANPRQPLKPVPSVLEIQFEDRTEDESHVEAQAQNAQSEETPHQSS